MKRFNLAGATLAVAALLATPALAQQHGHGVQQHKAEAAAAETPMQMKVTGVPGSPVHRALMDLAAIPALSSELSLSNGQSKDFSGIADEAARRAAEVTAEGAALSDNAQVAEVSAFLRHRAEVLINIYASAESMRAALSAPQQEAYTNLDMKTRHMAAMSAPAHEALMGLMGEGAGAQMMKMMGDMTGAPMMEHGGAQDQSQKHNHQE